MLFDDDQSYTAFKSGCRLSQSVTSLTPEYSLVLSAKLTSLDADTSLSISEIIIKNRRGPKPGQLDAAKQAKVSIVCEAH